MIRWVSADIFRERLNPTLWNRIAVSFSLGLFPLMYFLPSVFGVALFIGLAVKFLAIARGFNRFALFTAMLLMVIGGLLIWQNVRLLGISYAAVAFLAILSVCKLLESRNIRDVQVLFLLQILLMLAALMYSQSIFMFGYALLNLGAALRMLLLLEQRNSKRPRFLRFRDLGKLFLIAFPFAAMLFFFVPRVQPLWGIPRPQENNVTGLPDDMRLGGLTSLAKSDEVAFRVKFKNEKIPPSDQLYWRGVVLWHFDGQKWTQRQDLFRPPSNFQYNPQSLYLYDLLPVKPDLKWITPLDLPIKLPPQVKMGGSFQIPRPRLEKTLRYSFTSATEYFFPNKLSRYERKEALALPDGLAIPQLRGFSERLYQKADKNPERWAKAFLNYLRTEEFYYSLELPPNADDVENFFFRDKIGFCEHYSNAMAIAARTVGIPSRVVMGYQGGDFNPLSGEFVVREEAAHAWVELWIKGNGWVRFDPTAAVSPNRIIRGRLSRESLTSGEDNRSFATRMAENIPALSWLRNASDATQSFWQNWIIDLNRDRQISFLQKIGLGKLGLSGLIIMLMLLFFAAAGLFFWLWRRRPRENEDKATRAVRQLLFKLEKKGFIKLTSESPAAFFRRIALENPAEEEKLRALAGHYEALRYLESENDSQLLSLIKRIRL